MLEAGAFLLIWCDDEPEQGDLHATFKLSRDGEQVTLLSASGEVLDDVDVPELEADTSYARVPDGADAWQVVEAPTPGGSNGG